MPRRVPVAPLLIVTFCLALVPASVRAQAIPPACRPLIDAEEKQIMTPNHMYMTIAPAAPGAETIKSETITVGGVMYVMDQGKWMKSRTGPEELLAQMKQNLATAKNYSCQRIGEEAVNGIPAAVYTSHGENAGVKSDTRAWVATSTGLPLRSEEDVQAPGQSGKRHMSIRYEYTNVRAPAVSK